MSDDPIHPQRGRVVRVLDRRSVPLEVIAEVSGVPITLVPAVLAGEVGGPLDPEALDMDMSLLHSVSEADRLAAGREPQVPDDEQQARWLAEQSDHPRYVQVDEGWRRLLTSTADVEVAYGAAVKRAGALAGGNRHVEELTRVRDALRRVAAAAERAAEEEAKRR